MRLSELANLRIEDLDLVAIVGGRGRRPRACSFESKTGQAIDRYLRIRSQPTPRPSRGCGSATRP
jgi:site-specific recombinase XerC